MNFIFSREKKGSMPSQMDIDSDEFKAKEMLVDLEDEQERLQISIKNLQKEIEKREVEVRYLLAERELRLTQDNNTPDSFQPQLKLMKSQSVDFNLTKPSAAGDTITKFSSDFVRQVDLILDRVAKTSEELSTLIKL